MSASVETGAQAPATGFELASPGAGWLVARFAKPQRVCSWAIANGGITSAPAVAWMQVRDAELAPPVDPVQLLRERLAHRGLSDAVGLVTGVDVATYRDRQVARGGVVARCVATVGLGNALRVGDPSEAREADSEPHVGTINALCWLSVPLDDAGLLEASSIASAARTIAVAEAGVLSVATGAAATGTGTDCLVVACPAGASVSYAGMHTAAGSAVGAAVHAAVAAAVEGWLKDNPA